MIAAISHQSRGTPPDTSHEPRATSHEARHVSQLLPVRVVRLEGL